MKKAAILALALFVTSTPSFALEYITGRVTLVEPTYLPGLVTLIMDTGNASCPAGTFLRWQKSNENNKSAYASLLAALVTRSPINFVINDGDTTCTGQFLHILN
jgi:hypothetical protein